MPLSLGQVVFAMVFIALFVSLLLWAYVSDYKKQRKYYTSSLKPVIMIIVIFAFLIWITKRFS